MILLILPVNQYPIKYLNKILLEYKVTKVILYEHPYYYTKFKYHKLKLAYLFASFKCYYDSLKKAGLKVQYITYNSSVPAFVGRETISTDPIDYQVKSSLINKGVSFVNEKFQFNFLLRESDLDSINYRRHSAFYNVSKKLIKERYNIDFTKLSYQDKLNRKRVPKELLPIEKRDFPRYKTTEKYYKYAAERIDKEFPNNYGSCTNLKYLPINSIDAMKHFRIFVKNRLKHFGDYQDFISRDDVILYHSNLSYAINIGILLPSVVITVLSKIKDRGTGGNYEGLIRQIIGWREYMRYIYYKDRLDVLKSNSWGNKLSVPKNWEQLFNEPILREEIKKIHEWAWSHHIVRLMVFLNYFILKGYTGDSVYKWFMEHIALDAYDWVMVGNIYCMGYYNKDYTSKSYISSSNYLRKNSNYILSEEFTKLYWKKR